MTKQKTSASQSSKIKILRIFVFSGVILFAAFYIAAYLYVMFYGKAIVLEQLSRAIGQPVTAKSLVYQFPLGVHADQVTIGKIFNAEAINVQFHFETIAQKRVRIVQATLIQPIISFDRRDVDAVSRTVGEPVPAVSSEKEIVKTASVAGTGSSSEGSKVIIEKLLIQEGQFQYQDSGEVMKVVPGLKEGSILTLKDVQLSIEDLYLPSYEKKIKFNCLARFLAEETPFYDSRIKWAGWAYIPNRDMDAALEIIKPDGKTGLKAAIVSVNNDMRVEGEINISDLFKGILGGKAGTSVINDFMATTVSSLGVEIATKFSFQTKMDNFQINKVPFSGQIKTNEAIAPVDANTTTAEPPAAASSGASVATPAIDATTPKDVPVDDPVAVELNAIITP